MNTLLTLLGPPSYAPLLVLGLAALFVLAVALLHALMDWRRAKDCAFFLASLQVHAGALQEVGKQLAQAGSQFRGEPPGDCDCPACSGDDD